MWEKIDYIFPAFDDVIVALAKNSDLIKAKIVASPLDTCAVTRSKSKTYRALRDEVRVPKIYDSSAAVDRFPVFVKPDKGQGSQKAQLIEKNTQSIAFPTATKACYFARDGSERAPVTVFQ